MKLYQQLGGIDKLGSVAIEVTRGGRTESLQYISNTESMIMNHLLLRMQTLGLTGLLLATASLLWRKTPLR